MFTMEDLYWAYRKAKVWICSDRWQRDPVRIAIYEHDIESNLRRLLAKLNSAVSSGEEIAELLDESRYRMVPKAIRGNGGEVEMRVVADLPVDVHVISALWIGVVGKDVDRRLGRQCYGNRLVRHGEHDGAEGHYRRKSPYIFRHYVGQYAEWRDLPLKSLRTSHENGRVGVAATLDIARFYDHIAPNDYLSPEFFAWAAIAEDKLPFHRLFVSLLSTWKERVEEDLSSSFQGESAPPVGLPIGLAASAVLANAMLARLDAAMEEMPNPPLYGRYVDDLAFAWSEASAVSGRHDEEEMKRRLLTWIGAEEVERGDGERKKWKISGGFGDLQRSFDLNFDKVKIFLIDPDQSLLRLDAIEREFRLASSEWRMLPTRLFSAESTYRRLVIIDGRDGEPKALSHLRSASYSRLGFSLQLRSARFLAAMLATEDWAEDRTQLAAIVVDILLDPRRVVEMGQYLVEAFAIFAEIGEFDVLARFANAADKVHDLHLRAFVKESMRRALAWVGVELGAPGRPVADSALSYTASWAVYSTSSISAIFYDVFFSRDVLWHFGVSYKAQHGRLLAHVLNRARDPLPPPPLDSIPKHAALFNWSWLGAVPEVSTMLSEIVGELLPDWYIVGGFVPSWIVFPARPQDPFTWSALLQLLPREERPFLRARMFDLARKICTLERGDSKPGLPEVTPPEDLMLGDGELVRISPSRRFTPGRRSVALANVETPDRDWECAATGKPNLSRKRLDSFVELFNEAMSRRADYLLLPELSMPALWALEFGGWMARLGLSTIVGAEYIHHRAGLRNSAFVILATSLGVWQHAWLLIQDKIRPAAHEHHHLLKLVGASIFAHPSAKRRLVINHGRFHFGVLICSELLEIDLRRGLFGAVDMAAVLGWNKSLSTFGPLVESASVENSCFIALANNRRYGDSRIHGPYKDEFRREVVRLKGGRHDYIVAGDIPFEQLQRFHSRAGPIDSGQQFIPYPPGYRPIPTRRRWPIRDDTSV